LADDRGYEYHAGIHGLPLPVYCVHHDATGLDDNVYVGPLFLPWHRAYLYFFELSLASLTPGVTLPWWDWTTPVGQVPVVPAAYSGAGNPLAAGPINGIPSDQWAKERQSILEGTKVDPGDQPADTFRQPGQLEPVQDGSLPTPDDVSAVLDAPNFVDFTQRVERIHDNIHVWVGGTMSEIPVAAYDPLFWAHHCMIDRLWWLWQLKHPGANPPDQYLDQPLPPFPSLKIRDTLDVNNLGYEYALAEIALQPVAPVGAG